MFLYLKYVHRATGAQHDLPMIAREFKTSKQPIIALLSITYFAKRRNKKCFTATGTWSQAVKGLTVAAYRRMLSFGLFTRTA